jgi:DtxR family Mn-dependent transcriptional regulator
MPLRDLEPGDEGRITFIAPKEHARLDRLSSLGVIPGSTIKLHQKRPSFVIRIGETDLAIDEEIAKEIYVRKKIK